jgi:hypothetical protein
MSVKNGVPGVGSEVIDRLGYDTFCDPQGMELQQCSVSIYINMGWIESERSAKLATSSLRMFRAFPRTRASRAVHEATRPGRGKPGRDGVGRGATRQAGARRGRPGLGGRCRRGARGATGWIGVRRGGMRPVAPRAPSGTRAPCTALRASLEITQPYSGIVPFANRWRRI